MHALGWAPTLTIREAFVRTLQWLEANKELGREIIEAKAGVA
jgi:hypothetical protein